MTTCLCLAALVAEEGVVEREEVELRGGRAEAHRLDLR